MIISEEALREFKIIYKKEFDIDLSDQDVLEKATKLLNLMKAVYGPTSKGNYEKLQKCREKQKNREVENKEDWKARQNLFGFFSLLLKIDKRVNLHLYKK